MSNETRWREKKAYGTIAETIVEMLIKSMPNWRCVRFGVENHIEELRKIVRKDINPVTKKIKSMPDFIAFNTKTGKTFFIEVKFFSFIDRQTSGKSVYRFNYKRLDEYLEFWKETKLIIVHPHKPHFLVINLEDVKEEMRNRKQTGMNEWTDYWDFKSIEKDIKSVFPDLGDDVIEKAIKLIPNNKDSQD